MGNPFIKGLIASLVGSLVIPLFGHPVMGALIGFGFFIIGHAFGHKFGREEKEKELAEESNSQPEAGDGVSDGEVEGDHLA